MSSPHSAINNKGHGAARRDFLKAAAGLLALAIGGLAPVAAGLTAFLSPLRRRSAAAGFIRVAALAALPENGEPRKFPVIAGRRDAWTAHPPGPIGAIFLRRTGPKSVSAFNVACPHAGCLVEYRPEQRGYLCPCHNSRFELDGRLGDARSPSPRPLDELEVEVRENSEVWVKYCHFQPGRREKVAVP